MSIPYKNPTSGVVVSSPSSVLRTDTFGTTFSVTNTGGYMEVWTLSDLNYSTFGGTGNINNSGNTIPVTFFNSSNPISISNRLTLNSDAISSGRRRLGMLVYVHENEQTYQYNIDDYTTLWDAANDDGCITASDTAYVVRNIVGGVQKATGAALIAAWTGSTIEGISGATRTSANWRVYYNEGITVTGGTYYSGTSTLDLTNSTGGTFSVSGFTAPITGGTYNSGLGTLELNSADGGVVTITGFTSGGGGSPLSVGDGTTTVNNVSGMTFSGASVVDDGDGNITVTITGSTGTSGTSGTSGISGVDGSSGTSGTSGISGVDGSSGTSGVSGTSGTSGISGVDGSSGTSGVSGTSGTSGISGVDGSSGTS
jgi:hypothetical protein